jgi:hypothetical protein
MNGKLARVEEQEKLLLEKYLSKTKTTDDAKEIQTSDESHVKKKKRKHKDAENSGVDENNEDESIAQSEIRKAESNTYDLTESNDDSTNIKKKKKKKRSKENDE